MSIECLSIHVVHSRLSGEWSREVVTLLLRQLTDSEGHSDPRRKAKLPTGQAGLDPSRPPTVSASADVVGKSA